ncbi:MAG: hypothetical protein AAGJ52_13600, partial [Pseudomonadota bacterium]
QGQQYWLIGNGLRQGDQIFFESLNATRGASFGSNFNPDDVELIDWGSLRLRLSCNEGVAQYESQINGFGSGELRLVRLTSIAQLGCPSITSRLEELYEVNVSEILDSSEVPGRDLDVLDLAKNGSILARDFNDDSVWLRREGSDEFELLENNNRLGAPQLSEAGDNIIAQQIDRITGLSTIVRWSEEEGWAPIADLPVANPLLIGQSFSGETVFGGGGTGVDQQPFWSWTEAQGLALMDTIFEGMPLIPVALSEGATSFLALQSNVPFQPSPRTLWFSNGAAVELVSDDSPEALSSWVVACDRSCTTKYGIAVDDSPDDGTLWLSVNGSTAELIEQTIVDPEAFKAPYLTAVSGDGTIAAGTFLPHSAPSRNSDAFLWAQDLGFVKLSDLLVDGGLELRENNLIQVRALSDDGLKILVAISSSGSFGPSISRGALIQLNPH